MSPPSEIASAVVVLRWLVMQVRTSSSRRQTNMCLNTLRRYTLDDHKRLQEVDEWLYSLDEMAAGVGGRRRSLSVSEQSVARELCRESAGGRCAISGKMIGREGQVHHKVPLSYGGTWQLDNMCYLTPEFHLCIHDERLEQADWMTDAEWRRILRFRAIIAKARGHWQVQMSRQMAPA